MNARNAQLASPAAGRDVYSHGGRALGSREIRLERWSARCFHMLPCTFRVEITLDMSGCIVASLRDTQAAGYRRQPGGLILASDANRGGAIFIEIEPRAVLDPALVRIEGDLLVRALTPGMGRLREDVEELVHWATELDTEVDNFFVSFCAAEGPRSFRPTRVIAQLSPQQLVEPFEVLAQRQYFVRGGASVGW